MRNIAIQFSGGKDSTAMLYLFRDRLPDVTVYWANTGDTPPEVMEHIDAIRTIVPNFVEVTSNALLDRQINGNPTDALLLDNLLATYGATAAVKRRTSFDCCMANNMMPMHERMLIDGITDVYRGQRNTDTHKSPVSDGQDVGPYRIHFPIQDMSTDDVFAILKAAESEGFPVPTWYGELSSTPDCLTCTGWIDEARGEWLKKYHPSAYQVYTAELTLLRNELAVVLSRIEKEIN